MGLNFSAFSQEVPRLKYPYANEVTKDTIINFSWTKTYYGASTYQLQVATVSDFSSILTDASNISINHFIDTLTLGQVYYWRVRTSQGTNNSNWSQTRVFTLFSPDSISGLTVWLDPNNSLTMNGGNVQTMNDYTNNFNNASQVSVTQQPLLISSDSLINHKAILRFDGVNDFLEIADNASIDYTDAFSMHVLVKPTIVATNKTIMAKWDYQTQGSWAFQTDFATANQLMFAPCFNITDPGNQKILTTNANMQLLQPSLINLVFNGTLINKVKFYKYATLLTTTIVNTIPSVLPNSTATLKIGKYGGIATRYYQGDIGEILIYNTELTPVQKSLVDSYLRYKYAPPVSLGNDTIIAGNAFCTNIQLKAQYKFQSYLWSNGSTASSIYATAPGEYWVQATDFLGNVSTDTLIVYPPFELNEPIFGGFLCANDTLTWQTGYANPNFLFSWQDGSSTNFFNITQAGQYSVVISDLFGCTYHSDTLTIVMDNYAQNMSLGADTSLCVDNLIALQIGAAETVGYDWNGTSTIGQPAFWAVDTTGNYFVETTNINGCTARDTIHITISGQAPIANFSFQNQCFGLPNAFADLSVGLPTDAVVLWNWDLGDGNTNTTQSPAYTYGSAGTYTVQLYVESAGGCGAFHTETVTVHAVPIASFTKVGNCSGQSVQFTSTSAVGDAPISAYLWNFDQPWTGAANTSTIPTPFRTFDAAGTYDISLQVTDENGCVNDTIIPLVMDPSPIIAFTAADACANAQISFTNTSVVEAPATYLWDFGDLTSSILAVPVKYYSNIGVHTITLTATAGNGCVSTLQQQMYVNPNPVAAMTFGPMCMGTYTNLIDNSTLVSGSITSYLWIINSTDSLTGSTNNYVFNSLGQQQVVHQVTSDMGCTSTANQFVDVAEELAASFTASSSIIAAGEPITFTNTTPTLSIVSWDFGDGNSLNFVSPTTYQYGSNYIDSTVTVSMFVSNVLGCMDTATMTVSIQPMDLDLSLSNLYVQDINGFYTIGIELKNEGSITITRANLKVLLPDGPLASEVWNGNLIPGASVIYIFNSSIDAYIPSSNNEEAFLCATGVGFDMNNIAEVFLENNKVCKNLVGEAVVLLPIYPNPASNQVTIEMLITLDADVSLELLDARGRLIKTILPTQSLASGLYTYDVDISQIQAGTYFVRMRNGDVDVVNKLMISNY
jgi:PKD repeat protein